MFILLLLTVCFSLAVGSTYAQNNESSGSDVNTIQSGGIHAMLEWSKDLTDWDEFDSTDVVFGDNARWEPGYTEARYFRVTNSGDADVDVDFSYDFTITCDATGDNKLAEVIDVYKCDLPIERFTNRAELLTSAEYLGTLKELSGTALAAKDKLAIGENDGFTIVLSMQQNAGNAYQNLSLSNIKITVAANQIISQSVN